jgi:hypothetical protein
MRKMTLRHLSGQVGLHRRRGPSDSDTAITALSENEWTSLGAGPALVGAIDGDLLLVSAAAQPAPASVGFTIHCAGAPVQIQATGTLWARALMPNAQAVVQQ